MDACLCACPYKYLGVVCSGALHHCLVAAESSGTQALQFLHTYARKHLLNAGAVPVGPIVGVFVATGQHRFLAAVLFVLSAKPSDVAFLRVHPGRHARIIDLPGLTHSLGLAYSCILFVQPARGMPR